MSRMCYQELCHQECKHNRHTRRNRVSPSVSNPCSPVDHRSGRDGRTPTNSDGPNSHVRCLEATNINLTLHCRAMADIHAIEIAKESFDAGTPGHLNPYFAIVNHERGQQRANRRGTRPCVKNPPTYLPRCSGGDVRTDISREAVSTWTTRLGPH